MTQADRVRRYVNNNVRWKAERGEGLAPFAGELELTYAAHFEGR